MTTETVKGSVKDAPSGFVFVKECCEGCRRVIYGMVPLNVPVDPPRCSKCKEGSMP